MLAEQCRSVGSVFTSTITSRTSGFWVLLPVVLPQNTPCPPASVPPATLPRCSPPARRQRPPARGGWGPSLPHGPDAVSHSQRRNATELSASASFAQGWVCFSLEGPFLDRLKEHKFRKQLEMQSINSSAES